MAEMQSDPIVVPSPEDSQAAELAPEFGSKEAIKFLVEFGPLVVFFGANYFAGIFWATGAFMVATLVSLAASRYTLGRIPVMPLITAAFVCVFGGLTLWLQDDHFIKIKPTIVYCLFAAILLGGLISGRTFLKSVFGEAFQLTDEGWRKLTVRWGAFFIFLAGLNEVVWRSFSTDTWVSFKLFGAIPLVMIFAVAQIGLVKRYEKT